jgi:hypothetical protein
VTLIQAFVRNLRTWLAMEREKAQGEEPRGRKYQCVSTGADCSVVAMKRGNGRGAKGAGHSRRDRRVNWKQEELTGFGGRRQPLSGDTSRISREAYVRFCERLGVKFPGPTRRRETGGCQKAPHRALPQLYRNRYLLAKTRHITAEGLFSRHNVPGLTCPHRVAADPARPQFLSLSVGGRAVGLLTAASAVAGSNPESRAERSI